LGRIRQPTLVIAGRDDPLVPPANAHLLDYFIRDAKLHFVDDGHLFLLTSANESASVIQKFLA